MSLHDATTTTTTTTTTTDGDGGGGFTDVELHAVTGPKRDDEDHDSQGAKTIDELFDERIGQANKAQLTQFALSSSAWFPAAFLTLTSVFTARVPEWTCASEGACEDVNTGELMELCDMDRELWKWIDPKASIVSEWDLVCAHEYKVQLADSIFFVGFFFGAGLLGQLADAKGRVYGLYLSTTLASIGVILAAASNGYWMYFFCMSLRGFGCGGLGVASYVLCTEVLGVKWRAVLGISTQYFWSAGIALMAGIAYTLPEWRQFAAFAGFSGVAYIALSFKYLMESPRWYLATGQTDKAQDVMVQLAKASSRSNTVKLPPLKQQRIAKGLNVTAVFPFPALRHRLIAMAYIFCITSLVYYGLSLNVGSLSGSIYINTFISGIVEFPSHAFAQIAVDKLGRKMTLVLLMSIAAVGVLSSALFSGSMQVTVSMIGRFGIAGSFNMIYLYTTELFPTIVRSACLGTCSLAARLGGIIAPGIILAQAISPALPPIFLGTAAASACMVTLTLPETQGVVIEESLAGAARQNMGQRGVGASARDIGFTRLIEEVDDDTSIFSHESERL